MTSKTMPSTAKVPTPHYSAAICELDDTYMALCNWIPYLYAVAGPQLENFSLLSIFKIGAFESLVERFWQRYGVSMREDLIATDKYFGGYDAGIRRLQTFLRQYAYAKAGLIDGYMRPYCPLTVNWTWSEMRHARRMVAVRMLQHEQRVPRGEDPYPPAGPYPELNLESNMGNLVQPFDKYLVEHLSNKLKWLVNWSVLPRYETLLLIMHLEDIRWLYQNWKHLPMEIVDLAKEHGVDCAPVLEEYTAPYTVEAMPSQEEDKICTICTRPFSTECNDEFQTESAVTTRCGHVLGAHCLQRWANERGTCPFCRRTLCTKEQLLPLSVRGLYSDIQGLVTSLRNLDPYIDNLLAHERPDVEIHGQGFLNLLKTLRDYSVWYHEGIAEIYIKIEDEGKKKVQAYNVE
jgi:hypothetical protein